MRKIASYLINKYINPGMETVWELEVKNTANQKIPYRFYCGTSYPTLLGEVAKLGLCIDAEHMKIYNFDENGNQIK